MRSNLAGFLKGAAEGDATSSPDWEALTSLLRGYVRASMARSLRASCESMDVVNSVIGSLVEDLRSGRLVFDREESFRRYLDRVVQHKLVGLARRRGAQKRGGGETPLPVGPSGTVGEIEPPSRDPSPSAVVSTNELEGRILGLLDAEQRELWELSRTGASWADIGQTLGIGANAARMRVLRLRARLRELT